MLIRRLTLENFGLFRGRNEIDLAPRTLRGKLRPVILIGGKNGSGKTTLLEGIRLCLYGPRALGPRVSERKYEEYLGDRIHRIDGVALQAQSASVGMEFEYAQAGVRHLYSVHRGWDRAGGGVKSNLVVLRDGAPLDELDRAHADDFLRDLIPPGVSQLFFFDGEQIQQFADTEQDQLALGEAVRGLLGLDLIDRLQGDLRVYLAKLQTAPQATPLRAELAEVGREREAAEEHRRELVRRSDESQARRDRAKQEIAREEQRLTSAGGAFADKRASLLAEQGQLDQTIKAAEDDIRGLAESLLPFTLAPGLCRALYRQLEAERQIQSWHSHEELLRSRVAGLKESTPEVFFPKGETSALGAKARRTLTSRVSAWLDRLTTRPDDLPDVPVIHGVSESDRKQILGALGRVSGEIPRSLALAQQRLEAATRRRREVERSLETIPADEALRPNFDRLRELQEEYGTAQAEVSRCEQAVREADLRLEEFNRRERRLGERMAAAGTIEDRSALAARVRACLGEYGRALTATKVGQFQDAAVGYFSRLWRKGDLVRRIEIDPATFTVTLFDRQDRQVPKKQLSAGEKQIYAIAVLWALAQASGRPLPMVIDTPLGRLDSEHRGHLVERYFPHASHQVIILSTDTEIDRTYARELAPSVSHSYQLRYDRDDARCAVEDGYFWAPNEGEVGHAG